MTQYQDNYAKFMRANRAPRSRADVAAPAPDDPKAPLRQTVSDLASNAAPAAAQPVDVPEDFSGGHDPAFDVLSKASSINDDQRADSWEHYHSARDSKDLTARLSTLDAPNEVTDALVAAKQLSDPVPTHADKVMAGIARMMALDPRALDLAEKFPNILKALLSAGSDSDV